MIRLFDELGQPVCLWCGERTNHVYADYGIFLKCWNCGKELAYPELIIQRIQTLRAIKIPPVMKGDNPSSPDLQDICIQNSPQSSPTPS
jgi:hypothetical protein